VDDGIGNMLRTELFDSFDLKVKTGIIPSIYSCMRGSFILIRSYFDKCPDNVVHTGILSNGKILQAYRRRDSQRFYFQGCYSKSLQGDD
jgi:hypothetical protein